jgi:hypothetical protein
VDAVDRGASRNGQGAWPFLAGAAAASGFAIAVVVAQVSQVIDVSVTKLPTIVVTLLAAIVLALLAAALHTASGARSGAGWASAGLVTSIAVIGVPLSLILLPAAFLIGAGAAMQFEAEHRTLVRLGSVAVFMATFAVAAVGVLR